MMSFLRNITCILTLLIPAVVRGEVVIVSPANGAVVDPAFILKITYDYQYYGDTDFEDYFLPDEFEIYADGVIVLSCGVECQNDKMAEFQLMLLPGQHTLEAMARVSFGFHSEWSDPITLTVKGESATTGDTMATGDAPTSGFATETTVDTYTSGGVPTSGSATGDTGAVPPSGSETGTTAQSPTDTGTTGQPPPDSGGKFGCACDAGNSPGPVLPWLVAAGLQLRRRRTGGLPGLK